MKPRFRHGRRRASAVHSIDDGEELDEESLEDVEPPPSKPAPSEARRPSSAGAVDRLLSSRPVRSGPASDAVLPW
jgi:hypothetical protein